jgi:hypothetical protein
LGLLRKGGKMNFNLPKKQKTLILIEKICPICGHTLFQEQTTFFESGQVIYGIILCVECKKFTEKPLIDMTKIPAFNYPLEHWGF